MLKISPSADIFYKNYIAQYSENIFVGTAQTGSALKFTMLVDILLMHLVHGDNSPKA